MKMSLGRIDFSVDPVVSCPLYFVHKVRHSKNDFINICITGILVGMLASLIVSLFFFSLNFFVFNFSLFSKIPLIRKN